MLVEVMVAEAISAVVLTTEAGCSIVVRVVRADACRAAVTCYEAQGQR